MKKLFILAALAVSSFVQAGGYSYSATPTKINIIRSEGFLIFGKFGNPGECDIENEIFVEKSHSQYDHLYSTTLAAFMSGSKIQGYIHKCAPVNWHNSSKTRNVLIPQSTLTIKK
ncbi:Uncharacterised protein [BD1-7 clade bacterium]|uniref:Uncharacterized protein n=1 Tax=BD1-7 clade bacterium TaxID=2029982 RepID=A0A5S9R0B7_9GAMM|nr:Uncharacterised protein [BD1-7 clade bacterium]